MDKEETSFEELQIKVTWEVDDGYAGKARPQYFTYIPSHYFDEEEWNKMDDLEKENAMEEEMQNEFEKIVSPIMTSYED